MSASITRHRGFSVMELLLAMMLGFIIVAGIVQLFVGNNQTNNLLQGQARLQENARFGFDFIARAAQTAGFWGCAPEPDKVVKGLRGNWELVPEFDYTRPVEGFDAQGGGGWAPPLDTLPRSEGASNFNVMISGNGIDTDAIVEGTDVVALRTVRQPLRRLVDTLQPDGNPVVEAPGGNPGFGTGDVVMLSDCEQGAVFRVTNMTVSGDEATLVHATSAGGSFFENANIVESPGGAIGYTLSFLGRSYGLDATIGAMETTVFFVAPGAGVDNRGTTPNALWQKAGTTQPVELVEGIDDMQVLYGIDTTLADGIANANQYVPADEVPDPAQVVALRVTLAVNSVNAVTDDDEPLRRSYTRTIAVRNANPEA